MRAHAFTELVPLPRRGRIFTSGARAGLADCAPSGRVRLDALARWLQDVAYGDVEDAGVAGAAVWVVRRTRISVARFPRFGERFSLKTFCSGFGRAWAERRTTIVTAPDGDARDADAAVEAVALWVHLDPVSRRPAPLTAEELEIYGEAAAGRQVTARLRHQPPDGAGPGRRWAFRATDCDVAGHVNNAAYWQPLEEELLGGADPDGIDVEMEFRNPALPGEKLVLGDGERRWIVDGGGDIHASLVVSPVAPAPHVKIAPA
jgi:acyl-ACP thioesterase